jgi:hypothetical protein
MTNYRQVMSDMRPEEMIGEGCLDRSAPLGYPPSVRTEFGPTTLEYFRSKHLRGDTGTYYPLHLTGGPQKDHR